jgi:hypothetical protein
MGLFCPFFEALNFVLFFSLKQHVIDLCRM